MLSRALQLQQTFTKKKSKSSSVWLRENKNDGFYKKSLRENYRSRAAFKLIELDLRHKFLHPGQNIIDLGCSPGSWLQVALQKTNPELTNTTNKIVGVDLLDLNTDGLQGGVEFIQGDIMDLRIQAKVKKALDLQQADVVLSDMAPNLSGQAETDHMDCQMLNMTALSVAYQNLKPGGHFVTKTFQGYNEEKLFKILSHVFKKFVRFRPESSRTKSPEIFYYGEGFRMSETYSKLKKLERKAEIQKAKNLSIKKGDSDKLVFVEHLHEAFPLLWPEEGMQLIDRLRKQLLQAQKSQLQPPYPQSWMTIISQAVKNSLERNQNSFNNNSSTHEPLKTDQQLLKESETYSLDQYKKFVSENKSKLTNNFEVAETIQEVVDHGNRKIESIKQHYQTINPDFKLLNLSEDEDQLNNPINPNSYSQVSQQIKELKNKFDPNNEDERDLDILEKLLKTKNFDQQDYNFQAHETMDSNKHLTREQRDILLNEERMNDDQSFKESMQENDEIKQSILRMGEQDTIMDYMKGKKYEEMYQQNRGDMGEHEQNEITEERMQAMGQHITEKDVEDMIMKDRAEYLQYKFGNQDEFDLQAAKIRKSYERMKKENENEHIWKGK